MVSHPVSGLMARRCAVPVSWMGPCLSRLRASASSSSARTVRVYVPQTCGCRSPFLATVQRLAIENVTFQIMRRSFCSDKPARDPKSTQASSVTHAST